MTYNPDVAPLTWQQERFWHWNRGELFWDTTSGGAVKIPVSIELERAEPVAWVDNLASTLTTLSPLNTRIDPSGSATQDLGGRGPKPEGNLVLYGNDEQEVRRGIFSPPMALSNPALRMGAVVDSRGLVASINLVLCHSATDGAAVGLLAGFIAKHHKGQTPAETIRLSDLLTAQRGPVGRNVSARAMSYNARLLASLPSYPFARFRRLAGSQENLYTRIDMHVPGLASASFRVARAQGVSPASVLVAALAIGFAHQSDSEIFFSKVTYSNRSGALGPFYGCAYHEGLMLLEVKDGERADVFLHNTFERWLRAMSNARYSSTALMGLLRLEEDSRGVQPRLRTGINLFWNGLDEAHIASTVIGSPSWEVGSRDWPDDSVDLELKLVQKESDVTLEITMHDSLHESDELLLAILGSVAAIDVLDREGTAMSVGGLWRTGPDFVRGEEGTP